MGNIPVLKPNEVIAILIKLGFTEVRQRGSHKQFRDNAGRCTTVPFHQGRDISPTLHSSGTGQKRPAPQFERWASSHSVFFA